MIAPASGNRPKRTRLPPAARRTQLVDIAVELLLQGPLEDLTVETVADRAGVSRALIFHYFPTLRDLHLAALRVAADMLVEVMAASVAAADQDDRLADGLDTFVTFIIQQPLTFSRLASMAASDPEYGSVFQSVRVQAADLVVESLGQSDDPLRMMLILGWVSFVETVVQAWVAEPAGIDRVDLVAVLLDAARTLIK